VIDMHHMTYSGEIVLSEIILRTASKFTIDMDFFKTLRSISYRFLIHQGFEVSIYTIQIF